MLQNHLQTFENVDYKNYDNCCVFSYKKTKFQQKCKKCKTMNFINSTKHRDKINDDDIKKNCVYEFDENTNTHYKNYRTAYCLKCNTNYEINWKTKHYLFFGLICWKTTNLYIQNF